jgi:hypothetical protein
MSCIFCDRLAAGDLVAENDLAVALRDAFPLSPGHCLVVPRRREPEFRSLKAAAGSLRDPEVVQPEGWIEADGVRRLDEGMFVCRAVGRSMEPTTRDGDHMGLRAKPTGTCEGRVVLTTEATTPGLTPRPRAVS